MRRRLWSAVAVALACVGTLGSASPRRSDLDVYRDALHLDGGLTCYPVGRHGEALQRGAARLSDRRRAVGRVLRLRLGQEAVEAVESEVQSSLDNTDYSGCTLEHAAEVRRKLGWKLRALERRLGLRRPF